MTEKFVKKQVYECSKCKKLFDSKEEFNDHYENVHTIADEYIGAYVLSKKGDTFGKVIKPSAVTPDCVVVDFFGLWVRWTTFGVTNYTSKNRILMKASTLKEKYTIVPPEVFKKKLEEKFIEFGYAQLKADPAIVMDFGDILSDGEYREKGDENDGH